MLNDGCMGHRCIGNHYMTSNHMGSSSAKPKPLVVLVHGFNKRATDMAPLKAELESRQWLCSSADLPTRIGTFTACVDALTQHIALQLAKHPETVQIHFVAHSLGGLVVRACLRDTLPKLFASRAHQVGHSVLIATPHVGTPLANYANWVPFYHSIFKPLQALTTNIPLVPLPTPRSFKIGTIAGTLSSGPFGWMLQSPNDGRVELNSACSDDADACIQLHYNHKRIHHQPLTFTLVDYFLRHGCFPEDAHHQPHSHQA